MLGFPGESWEEVCETINLMDDLEKVNPCIMVSLPSIFCPYPGTPLLDVAVNQGFEPPASLEDWGTTVNELVRHTGCLPPYVDYRVERVINYLRLARVREFNSLTLSLPSKIFKYIAQLRWKHRYFSFPVDWYIANSGRRLLKKGGKM